MLLKGYLAFAYLEKFNLDLIILFRPLFLSTTLLRSVPTRNADVAILLFIGLQSAGGFDISNFSERWMIFTIGNP